MQIARQNMQISKSRQSSFSSILDEKVNFYQYLISICVIKYCNSFSNLNKSTATITGSNSIRIS